jgi:hypothetical protein
MRHPLLVVKIVIGVQTMQMMEEAEATAEYEEKVAAKDARRRSIQCRESPP